MIHDYYKYGEYENYIEMIKKKIKKGMNILISYDIM